ncbi:MAG: hypothetical protein ABI759_09000 [Candidatus Solibacter sp.]
MSLPQLLGGIHGLLLVGLSWRSAARLCDGGIARVCGWFLLVWSNLVYTALLLAAFSRLDHRPLYFAVSLTASVVLEALLWRRRVHALAAHPGHPPEPAPHRVDTIARRVLGVTLLLAALASLVICYFYVPNNWDSLTYRFSRAFFYLGRGDLLHVGNPLDPRLHYYPLNGTLFYLFFAIYQFSAIWFHAVTCLAWILAGTGTFYVARCLGASPSGSFVAMWICLLCPSVLAQAASTNDEVLSAVPLLLALAFLLEWFAAPRWRYVLLAGLGLGLGLGTKLHWVFYWAAAAAAAAIVLVRIVRNPAFRWDVLRRIPAALAAGAVAAPLACAFLVANYLSVHKLTDEAFNNVVLNRPFRLSLAREKIRINMANLFVSPLPDLLTPVNHYERRKTYTAFNGFFMRCCFSDLVETTKRSPEGNLFEGPADPEGAWPHEYTVWLGFMPHLMLLVCLAGAFSRGLPRGAIAVAAAFFCWCVTCSVSSRFIPTASVYYSFPAVLGIAALGPAWDFARGTRRWSRVLAGGFAAVIATHMLLGANLLAFGGMRNLQFAWHGKPAPDAHPVAPSVAEAIGAARRIYIPYSHWEVLYWNFMRFNFAAKYSTGVDLRTPSPDTMMLLTLAREGDSDFFPARLPAGTAAGLVYLGDADGQPILAQGGGAENLRSGRARYLVLPLSWRLGPEYRVPGVTIQVSRGSQQSACCLGVTASDGIEYRYELRSTSGASASREWRLVGDADPGIPPDGRSMYDSLVVETRLRQRPGEIARTERRASPLPYDLSKDGDAR